MPWWATRIPALCAGRIRGYSNSENSKPFSLSEQPLIAFAKLSYENWRSEILAPSSALKQSKLRKGAEQ